MKVGDIPHSTSNPNPRTDPSPDPNPYRYGQKNGVNPTQYILGVCHVTNTTDCCFKYTRYLACAFSFLLMLAPESVVLFLVHPVVI